MNFLGDLSPNRLAQSHSLMVNYLYSIDKIEKNHEVFAESGQVVASAEIRRTLRGDLASSDLVAAR